MTVALYARRKQWPLTGVLVRLTHSKIHAADCAECETKEGKLDRIESEITLEGALDAEQRVESALVVSYVIGFEGVPNHSLPKFRAAEVLRAEISNWWIVQRPLNRIARPNYRTQYRSLTPHGFSRLSAGKRQAPDRIAGLHSALKDRDEGAVGLDLY